MDMKTNTNTTAASNLLPLADPIVTEVVVGGRTLKIETSLAPTLLDDPVLAAWVAARLAAGMVAHLA